MKSLCRFTGIYVIDLQRSVLIRSQCKVHTHWKWYKNLERQIFQSLKISIQSCLNRLNFGGLIFRGRCLTLSALPFFLIIEDRNGLCRPFLYRQKFIGDYNVGAERRATICALIADRILRTKRRPFLDKQRIGSTPGTADYRGHR